VWSVSGGMFEVAKALAQLGEKWGVKPRYGHACARILTQGGQVSGVQLESGEVLEADHVIFNGDVLSRHSIADQIAFHIEKKADVTLHLIDVEDARAFGCVPTDSSGRVTAFLEKMDNPVTNSINAGCYVFSPSVIDEIPLGEVVSIERETFPALVAGGRAIFGYKDQSYWLDVGTPAALFKGSRDLVDGDFLAQAGTTIADGAQIIGGSSIGAGCIIEAGVVIDGCIIGDKVVVGAGSHLSQCFVTHGTLIAPDSQKTQKYLSASGELSISL